MSFQTRKTFFHLRNKKYDVFDEIWELSEPCIDSNTIDIFKAQKGSKDINKIVHVISAFQQ